MLSSNMMIRQMAAMDVATVYALECCDNPDPWSEKTFNDCIKVGYDCFTLVQEETILGFAIFNVALNEAHLLNIVIHPNWQRQGLGEKLLLHCISLAKQQNADMIYLEVRESNIAARNLYSKLNFIEIGRRKDYYPVSSSNSREDALVLALALGI